MAERVILKAYEVGNNKINTLNFDQVYTKYHTLVFKEAKKPADAYNGKWKEIKERLAKKSNDVKHEDDMYYMVANLGNANFLVFAIGTGKKDTLQKIYLKALEEQKGKGEVQEPVKEEPKAEVKEVKKEAIQNIDLSDANIGNDIKFSAIANGNAVNKLDEDGSYEYLRNQLTPDVINKFKTDKAYTPTFFTQFANMLKTDKTKIDKYTVFTSTEIAKMLKELMEESKTNERFYAEVMGV